MQIASTLTPQSRAVAPRSGQRPEGDAGSALAGAVRAAGQGANMGSSSMAVAHDFANVTATDAVYGAAAAAAQLPVIGRPAGAALRGLGFATGYVGLVYGGMLRVPGQVASDLANAIAGTIDGQTAPSSAYIFPPAGAAR